MKNIIKTIILFMLLGISAFFCTNTFAVSKNDIIGYVNSQSVCGDTALFKTYKTTFTRLLKQKRLTQSDLNTIYYYLQNSVGILNSKGVCKIADLKKLTVDEKNAVYNNLTAGAGIITSAPMLQFGEQDEVDTDKNTSNDTNVNPDVNENTNNNTNTNTENIPNEDEGTKVTINTQDNTMDIYENGVLVDKVSMSGQKMTYTGTNTNYVVIVVLSLVLFMASLITYMTLVKIHNAKTRFVKNILMSIIICSAIVGLSIVIFGSKIESLQAMIDLISISSTDKEIEVELNEDKSIKTYPSYASNYATLKIEKLGVEANVYFGDIASILSMGIGHSTWSAMPTEGEAIVYSGHNRKDMLNNIKDIAKGNEVIVDTSYATCTYVVEKTDILKDHEVDKLAQIEDKETLILYTCYPFDKYVYSNERFVVYSVLKDVKWK